MAAAADMAAADMAAAAADMAAAAVSEAADMAADTAAGAAAEAAAGEAAAAAAGAGAGAAAACHGEVATSARLEHLPMTLKDASEPGLTNSTRPTYVLCAALPTQMRGSGVRREAEWVAKLTERQPSQKS
jgi:hypothetical protein